jgi:polyisoprenoid-binding protein YceI
MNRTYFPIVVTFLLFSGGSALAQTSSWKLDTNHTQVDFQIRRVPVSTVRGSFGGITGTVVWDEKDPSKCSVEAVIPTSSISTNNETRDKDLRSDNFFDVAKYPTMTFKSTAVTGTPGKLHVVGNLTLAGVTKLVTFEVEGATTPAKMGSKLILGFAVTGTILRSDFNFASKYPTLILGDEIKFTIDAEADK